MTAKTYRKPKFDRLLNPGASATELRCDYAVAPFDRVALDMERLWGIDRLPELVGPVMAERFGRAMAHLNDCMNAEDAEATAAAAANCIKGLHAMDAEARRLGHVPVTPDVWFIEVDGKRVGLIRDVSEWPPVAAAHPGVTLYTMREVAIALEAHKNALPTIAAVKASFPGAQIAAVRQRSDTEEYLDDQIPF